MARLVVLLAALVLAAGLQAAAWPAGSDQLDAFVESERAKQKIPGVAVAIVRGSEVVKRRGYGLANVEHAVPVTHETIFQSGSVGKQFTAAAVMLQVEDGTLSLDDPLTRFYPDAPSGWRRITVRHLLTHTSGIADYGPPAVDYRRDYSEDEFARVAYGLALEFPPGSRWSYSNTGYALLGFIVRKVSGRFYGDVLAERVFRPLGMTTARVISEAEIVPHRAAGYRLVEGALRNQEWVSPLLNTQADGSLYLSVEDMLAWDRGLRKRALLRPESWTQVFTPVTLTSGTTHPYGFGWRLYHAAGQRVERHGGSWQGFKAEIARFLGSDLTVVVFANLAEAKPEIVADGLAALVDPALAAANSPPE